MLDRARDATGLEGCAKIATSAGEPHLVRENRTYVRRPRVSLARSKEKKPPDGGSGRRNTDGYLETREEERVHARVGVC